MVRELIETLVAAGVVLLVGGAALYICWPLIKAIHDGTEVNSDDQQ